MTIDLYYMPASPPCWSVHLAAAALGVKLNLKLLDFDNKEHLGPDFVKINPQHTIPTLVDNGFPLWESRSIIRYLANKYGAGSSLYPTDPEARALVDQRLDFDLGTLYPRLSQYIYPQFAGAPADPELLKKLEEALGFLNTFLEGRKYAAGSNLTIADLALAASMSSANVVGISLKAFPNIERWFLLVKSTAPGYDELYQTIEEACKELLTRLKRK